MFKAYLFAGVGILAFAASVGSYFKGRADGNANGERRVQAMLVEARQAQDAEALRGSQVAVKLETQNAAARIVYRTLAAKVRTVAARPIYIRECFDEDGLALVNAALAGVDVQLPPRPLPAVPQ